VISAVGIIITLSVILLGLGSSRTSFSLEQSNQAKALANACAEEALWQIRDSMAFTGSGSLVLGQGTCGYAVTARADKIVLLPLSVSLELLPEKKKSLLITSVLKFRLYLGRN